MKSNKAANSFEEFQVLWKSAAFEESMMRCTSHNSVGLGYVGSRDKNRLCYPQSEALIKSADNLHRAERCTWAGKGEDSLQQNSTVCHTWALPRGTIPLSTMSAQSNSMTHEFSALVGTPVFAESLKN